MLHLVVDRALQADEIRRHGVVEDLPPAVGQRLVAERPARQDGVEVGAVGALHQDAGAGFDVELA
jgi:hypothetical protein